VGVPFAFSSYHAELEKDSDGVRLKEKEKRRVASIFLNEEKRGWLIKGIRTFGLIWSKTGRGKGIGVLTPWNL